MGATIIAVGSELSQKLNKGSHTPEFEAKFSDSDDADESCGLVKKVKTYIVNTILNYFGGLVIRLVSIFLSCAIR